jgi:hypothetical protein
MVMARCDTAGVYEAVVSGLIWWPASAETILVVEDVGNGKSDNPGHGLY